MQHPKLSDLCEAATHVVRQTGQFLLQELGKVSNGQIETKSLNSLVSYVDQTAEEQLVAGLGELLPEATFLTEEGTVITLEADYQWIIDPLDGTTNFLHQIPVFAISVALQYKKETVLAVVLEVNRNECFYAWRDGGAWLNGRSIRVAATEQLSDSLLATGFPYHDFAETAGYLRALEYFMRNTRGLRRIGTAATDLAYVACGRFGGFFEYSLSPWDVAAGALLVQEAGGRVSDFSGGENYLHGQQIIATNAELYDPILSVIQEHFG